MKSPIQVPILDQRPRSSLRVRICGFLNGLVREDVLLEAEMLVLSFATGIEDATTYPDYHCFVSNQTGNTVLIAVGISGAASTVVNVPNIAISLSTFVLGGWAMGQLGNFLGCRRRGWLILSSIVQTALVFIASGLQFWRHGSDLTGTIARVVIALLALSSGGQVAMVRALKVTEITTANATSAYVDTFIDVNLYKFHNRARNRRFLFLLSLGAGSFAGAFAYKRFQSPTTLLISALGKAVVTLAFCFNKELVE